MNAWTIALDSIWHHKLRSTLTALGIVIGVFAVVTLTSLGGGVRQYVTDQFDKLGANLITVLPASPTARDRSGGGPGGGGGPFGLLPSTLTVADAHALAGLRADHVAAAAPVASAAALVSSGAAGAAATASSVVGTEPPYFAMEQLRFSAGGPWQGSATGVVLGHTVAATVFGSGTAVGRTVTLNGTAYTVDGVLAAAGQAFGADPDRTVYMPVASALSMSGTRYVSEIIVKADGNAGVNAASAAVQRVLAARHKLKDFAVVTSGEILFTINSTLTVITAVLGGIAAISLLVGGIGIMNIMLVTVTERIKEIGTRKALGARDGDILVQFLVESVLLAVLGGAVGTLLSAVASHIVGTAVHFTIGLTGNSVAAALAFSIMVGVVFGVAPAMNAARLAPAAALRSE